MEKFLGLDLKKGKICSPCYYTPTTFIIQLLETLFNPLNLVCINDIDSLTIPDTHAEVLQYINGKGYSGAKFFYTEAISLNKAHSTK